MSKTLLSRIKPRFRTSPTPPPGPSLRRLVGAVSDVLAAEGPSWEDDLDSLFADTPQFSVSDVLARIADAGACLKLFRWAARLGWIGGPADAAACSSVLKVLARVRDLPEIERVRAGMAEAGVFPTKEAWEAVVRAYSDAGQVEKALDLYELGKKELKDVPSTFTCNALLGALVKRRRIATARQVYDEMREREQGDNYTTCILVGGYCKEGKVEEGRVIIDDRWGRGCVPDVIFYNILIDGYCKAGDVQKAYALFNKMKLEGFLPTLASYGAIIKGLCAVGSFELVDRLIADMKHRGMVLNEFIYNTLIDAKCRHGSSDEAISILRSMDGSISCKPDIITYNTLIANFCRAGRLEEADVLLREAIERGLEPNKLTYTPFIRGYCTQGESLKATTILVKMVEKGIIPDVVTYGVLVHGFVAAGEMDEAIVIHDKMVARGILPDAAFYNVLVNGLFKMSKFQMAKKLLAEMMERGVVADEFLYATVIDGLVRNGELEDAKKVFELVKTKSANPGIIIYNAIIKGYCKLGMMDDAISCLDGLIKKKKRPDEFTFTTIIDGFVKQNNLEEAVKIFYQMVKRKCKPNAVTYTALINGFCRKGDVDKAHELFIEMQSRGLLPNVVTYSILLGGFCNNGDLQKASMLFEEMLLNKCIPNDVTYNYLISGLEKNLMSMDDQYKDGGLTFLGIYKRLVQDEWDFRNAAYNAIIFCLCKNGMLESAFQLQDKMTGKGCLPDSISFVSLLHGLCHRGKSREWKSFLSASFTLQELEIAHKYSVFFDCGLYEGVTSEATRIVRSLIEKCHVKFEDHYELRRVYVSHI